VSKKPKDAPASLGDDFAAHLRATAESVRFDVAGLSFRDFLFSPAFAGPYMAGTGVSPAIEAIALASEGLEIPAALLPPEMVRGLFRTEASALAGRVPRVVVVGAGRRAGKTANLLAPKCVHAAWTTPVPTLKHGEIARAVIISPDTDQSGACFAYCRGIVESSPILSRAVERMTNDEIVLRRPDGKLVEIVVGAASRGGKAARSRSVVFCALDEACFFFPDGSHVANDQDIYDAALGTIKFVAGAQIWVCSTPWIDGVGVMEELIEEHWGRPGFALVAARISSYLLRGVPDDGSLREGMDDDTYNREILAQPLPEGTTGFFSMAKVIEAETREVPKEARALDSGAGTDLGFLRDSSAMVIAARLDCGLFSVEGAEEFSPAPGEPLRPTVVCNHFAASLKVRRIRGVAADVHEKATAIEIFGNHKIQVVDAPSQTDEIEAIFRAAKALFDEDRMTTARLSEAERTRLRDQLRMIVSKPRPGGGFTISAPRAPSKQTLAKRGRSIRGHADSVSALVRALWRVGSTDRSLWRVRPKIARPPAAQRLKERRAARAMSRREDLRGGSRGGYFGGR
jgi:hypothetical protein